MVTASKSAYFLLVSTTVGGEGLVAAGGPRLAAAAQLAGLAVPGLVEGDDAVIGGEH
jgi:hypothetical protein